MMPAGGQRGAVTRNVLADPDHTAFPQLTRGTFSVDSDLSQAVHAQGNVSITFVPGNEFGSGRAVFGAFDAQVLR